MEVISNPDISARIFKFGVFELRSDTGELWKHGVRVKLQTKPLQILEALLAVPGEVITREELFKKLWPDGTYVDFESGLNTATNRLRTALGDSAETPRYVETLPRLGYRFICPVTEKAIVEKSELSVARVRDAIEPALSLEDVVPAEPPNRFRRTYEAALALLLLAFVILVLFYVHAKVTAS
ncbi:MAG: winged helix-turn-helix domain-containing protein [Acidobacteriaceae bacterium]|nr:winged helix-turn-helix domain-containing protein [Acidobacteriaceae bacterium]